MLLIINGLLCWICSVQISWISWHIKLVLKSRIIWENAGWFILDMQDNKEACLHTAVHVYKDYEHVWQKEVFFLACLPELFWLCTEVNVFKCQTRDCVDVMSNLQKKTETWGSHLFPQIIRSNLQWSTTQNSNDNGCCEHDTNKSGCVFHRFTTSKHLPLYFS